MNVNQLRNRAAAKAAGFEPKWRHPDADEMPTAPRVVKMKKKTGRKARGRK